MEEYDSQILCCFITSRIRKRIKEKSVDNTVIIAYFSTVFFIYITILVIGITIIVKTY